MIAASNYRGERHVMERGMLYLYGNTKLKHRSYRDIGFGKRKEFFYVSWTQTV